MRRSSLSSSRHFLMIFPRVLLSEAKVWMGGVNLAIVLYVMRIFYYGH